MPSESEIQAKRAVELYRAGKSWRASALEAGLSDPVSRLGAAGARKAIKAIDQAFADCIARSPIKPAELKALSLQRLVDDIERGKSSGVAKEIDLLGKFKEHDWWIRNIDVQIGVFAQIGESSPAEESIDAYKEDQ